ncbi:MAG TPA: pilus assembly PilX N-terminal domain-containing protein [Verrucomicrobiae bacterium]|nr:pilus assembly PilX N-terminal domain-containing protein [Verrucomicrobiae bacterium]
MKTRKFTISRSERSSPDWIGTLTNSRNSREASLAGQPAQQSGDDSANLQSPICNLQSQRGIALVITLILLAVTLVMAVAFLAISRRERNAVSTSQDAATAKFAADSAQARAIARIVTQMEMTTNPYVFSLIVSTNYVNRLGFVPGVPSLTNVNYDYEAQAPNGNGAGPISSADLLQNIANLYYDPRPPVFYSNDFRFYLDLNRNGRYDTNGLVEDMDNSGRPIINASGTTNYSWEVGDPEWIGILAHPDQPHGPNNPFIGRYCFIAVPANSADLNYIHNQAFSASSASSGLNNLLVNNDGYFRNQGVGTWEINLAAFLADLDTNIWDPNNFNGYQYLQPVRANSGLAFSDAFDLLTNRYANFYPSQPPVQSLFGVNGINAFQYDGIDAYTRGPVQTTFDVNYAPETFYNYSWVGAPNTNNFFTPDDLFDTNKTANFGIHLQNAGVNLLNADGNSGSPATVSTYDRYTFYRMLGQLGTDTQPASGKINLNYQNALLTYDFTKADIAKYGPVITNVAANIAIVPNMETNFQSWSPHDFFTAAADKLLRAYSTEWYEESPSNYMQTYYGYYGNNIVAPISGFSLFTNIDGLNITNVQFYGQTNQIPYFTITNIPVYVNGSFVYSPAVNRLLQLAANIYDASTNVSTTIVSNYPSVFRPVFCKLLERNNYLNQVFTNVYIRGFQYVPQPLNQNWIDAILTMPGEVTDLPIIGAGPTYSATNVWGVPWIVGAKKGLPNFNGLEIYNTFFIERKLQFNRSSAAVALQGALFPFGRVYTTNQMYIMGVSNCYAMDDQNSYNDTYADPVTIVARDSFGFGLSNDAAGYLPAASSYLTTSNETVAGWPGVIQSYNAPPVPTYSFEFPLGTNQFLPQNLSAPVNGPTSSNNEYIYHSSPVPITFQSGGQSYTFTGPCFVATSLTPPNYMDTNNVGTPPLPHLVMLTTNRLQAYMLDTQNPNAPYILDYVQLGGNGMNSSLDVNQAIADPNANLPGGNNQTGGMWSTNLYSDSETPFGVIDQYLVSLGDTFPSTVDADETSGTGQIGWSQIPVPGVGTATPAAQTAYFQAFFSGQDKDNSGLVTNLDLSMQAPFTPMRAAVQRYVYQINDPLVHYMTQDLFDFPDSTNSHYSLNLPPAGPSYVYPGNLSDRYMPWGQAGNLAKTPPADNNPFNYSYKDPMITAPDYWDFPTNKYPTVGWLGRVHRGTPWQTVYLKSPDILFWSEPAGNQTIFNGVPTWQLWTGNAYNAYDAINTAPDQDRLLFDLFTAAPDDDAMRGQISVNIGADDPTDMLAGLASWSALLSGSVVFTNNVPDQTVGFQSPNPPSYGLWTIQPLGAPPYPDASISSNALWQIVTGINSARTNYGFYPYPGSGFYPYPGYAPYANPDGLRGVFEHVGDILRVPQLSVSSPFINNDPVQEPIAINDEMYEWLPQQIMGLLTVSGTPQNPPRYVIYCYGQTLKPAPNGLVSSGQYFGMCTNYQVTAESAARVVIEVHNTPTPANPTATPHVVVEQYNPLPPD